jgi:hypothetical protein
LSKYILKLTLFLFFFLTVLPLMTLSYAQQETEQIPFKPISIQLESQNQNQGKLTLDLSFTNPNSIVYRSAYYTVKLQSPDIAKTTTIQGQPTTEFTQGPLINFSTSDKFDLNANELKKVSLNLEVGTALASGKYKLQVSIFSDADNLIGGLAKEISLDGSGTFLSLSKCVLVVNKIEYDPIIGPNIAPKEPLFGKCLVSNPSNSSVTVFSEAEYAVNSVADKTKNQFFSDKTPITIGSRSSKSVNFPLPPLEIPQVYESLSYLKDEQGNMMSPRVAFRWIVGGESSLIRSIDLDKSEYKSGEVARVTVGADPSMDLYWRGGGPIQHFGKMTASSSAFVTPEIQGTPLTDPTISVSIKDQNGNICGTNDQKVTIDPNQNIWPDQVINVSINKDCQNPSVLAKVLNNGKALASKEVKVPVLVSPDQQSAPKNVWWIIGLLVVLVAVVAGIIYKKKKTNSQPPKAPISPPENTSSSAAATKTLTAIIVSATFFGLAHSNLTLPGVFSLSLIKTTYAATEVNAGTPVSVHYEGISAFRRGQPCPGPVWTATNPQPQGDDGQGGCVLGIVSGHDETNFTFLDTQNQIVYENGGFTVPISGQFKGYGCGNSKIGLIVRAYINGSSENVKINGGTSKAIFDNLGSNGGGSGTDFTQNLTITSVEENFCGPKNIKIELIPYIKHAGIVASDKVEDQLLTAADVAGWNEITYNNRKNCGSGDSCFGVLQKSNIPTASCLACNLSCESTDQCLGNTDGCTECRSNESGQKVCQPPTLACNATCSDSKDCAGNKEGCTSCEPNAQGTGKVCAVPPACGVGCERDDQCAGAVKDGCTVCAPNESGKKVCQVPFDEGACKCDGFNALNLQNPSNSNFQFEAFGKVEGGNVKSAQIKSIQFQMTKSTKSNPNSGTIIASSDPLTPEIVSSTDQKVRYRSAWSVTPPAFDPNGVYRVFANIKCARKNVADSGLENILGSVSYSSDNNLLYDRELNYSPIRLAQTQGNLQLGTLEDGYFTKITETDSCRFIRFEYGQY